jgi:RecA-family ATPase
LAFPDATIFVCEGEKDADRVASLNHCATTVASGEWTDDCINALAGRDCLILEDNDEAGRAKALAAAKALHGTAKTIRIVRLPDLADGDDVSDWLDADPRRADKLVDVCFDAPLWEAEPEDPTDEKKPEKKPDEVAPLPFTSIASWHGMPVPERRWTVLNRVPAKNVTLMSGDGGVGKTILALHLCAAIALGRDWLGSMPQPGPAMGLFCEDDDGELHRRIALIADYYGVSLAEMPDLHVRSMAGDEALLATPDKNGIIKPTDLFIRLQKTALDIRPRLIVIDNSADVFGGNENDRAQVRQFITVLRGLAMTADAGVLLTSHPSLTGISSGSGLSGSTGWNNNVRSRMYFKKVAGEKDDEPDPDARVLEIMKANYGPVGETIPLRWKNGLFLPAAAMGTLDKAAAEQAADDLFLKLLNRCNGQGRNVSHAKTSNTYAPTLFATDPEGKGKRRELTDAMNRLFAADRIKTEEYGRGKWRRIVPK